jgi:hypothetical protein
VCVALVSCVFVLINGCSSISQLSEPSSYKSLFRKFSQAPRKPNDHLEEFLEVFQRDVSILRYTECAKLSIISTEEASDGPEHNVRNILE